jgi:hypothetical protein
VVEILIASCGAEIICAFGQACRWPFADMIGTQASLDGDGRVQVLLGLLDGEVPESVAREALMPAHTA